jgi:hypothetical protein
MNFKHKVTQTVTHLQAKPLTEPLVHYQVTLAQKYLTSCHVIADNECMPPADMKIPLFSKRDLKLAVYQALDGDHLLLVDASLVDDCFRINLVGPGQVVTMAAVDDAVSKAVTSLVGSSI